MTTLGMLSVVYIPHCMSFTGPTTYHSYSIITRLFSTIFSSKDIQESNKDFPAFVIDFQMYKADGPYIYVYPLSCLYNPTNRVRLRFDIFSCQV